MGRNPDPVNIHRLSFIRSLLCSLVSSLVTKATMTRRTPSAAVVAAFLLGTWSADAFQPHAHVSSVRPSRVQQNGSTVDMISVFGRDVQVRLLSRDGIRRHENQLVGRVAYGTNCTGWPKTLTRRKREGRCGPLGILWKGLGEATRAASWLLGLGLV